MSSLADRFGYVHFVFYAITFLALRPESWAKKTKLQIADSGHLAVEADVLTALDDHQRFPCLGLKLQILEQRAVLCMRRASIELEQRSAPNCKLK